jgi:hypothetical protein
MTGVLTVDKVDATSRVDRHRVRASLAVAIATLAATGLLVGPLGRARAEQPKLMLMFVQTADDVRVDPASHILRLINVGQQTLYFADRPERVAGHVKMADFLTEWTSKAGADNFGNDPPNATISVFEPGKAKDTLAVVKISNPKVEGTDLLYSYTLIEGSLPATGGATALFIDWIGPGGGVGFGFHGVGVGYRGPGWR